MAEFYTHRDILITGSTIHSHRVHGKMLGREATA